ncbi:hypothetical protein [Ruegeria conchae]|uniref:hypothetical protein n=1 Tax=Ruegeria conchae TaxID=981384 RepID=UPI001EE677CD|nr:hypothetical protein [Ruegeria conchae]
MKMLAYKICNGRLICAAVKLVSAARRDNLVESPTQKSVASFDVVELCETID